MNKFKKGLKKRIILLSILGIFLISLAVITLLNKDSLNLEEHNLWRNIGCSFGLVLGIGINILSILPSLKNDDKLNEMYIKSSDERTALIVKSTSTMSYIILLYTMVCGMIVSTFFSNVVSNVFFYGVCYTLVVYCITYFYYNRKF
ncbi:putative membrane protein [Bacilli bacterium PM5-3]|nr:putative membrane protein [Bacilli bacterium PM5-3]